MIVPRNTVLQGHVLDRLRELPEDCVDVVVTSTPYWGLRDYGPDCVSVWGGANMCVHQWVDEVTKWHSDRGDAPCKEIFDRSFMNKGTESGFCIKCGAWRGQLGLEPHPQMFVDHLAQVFGEVYRVLKPSGSLWLNLGDTYFGGNGKAGRPEGWKDLEGEKLSGHAPESFIKERNKLRSNWLRPKQKMLIPARVAIALQEQGWILRNEVIWNKINHMPSSVRDRLTSAYESVYFFVKNPRYYFDLTAIRTALKPRAAKKENGLNDYYKKHKFEHNLSGANPGDVWSFTNEGLSEEHYAAFPQKLVRRILEAAAPKQICNNCGVPRQRIVQKDGYLEGNGGHVCRKILDTQHRIGDSSIFRNQANNVVRSFIGWSDCGCNVGFQSGVVLDPFAGAGTSLLVAHKMGLDWLGIELVPKYCKIIEKRIEKHGKLRLDGFIQEPHGLACGS